MTAPTARNAPAGGDGGYTPVGNANVRQRRAAAQARIIKRYVSGLLHDHPALATLVDHETADALWLTNGLCVEIHTCSFRSLRGYTVVGAACDEVAFWSDETSTNPDREVLIALRAAMVNVPEAMLIALSSVYAKRGEVWRTYDRHFGQADPDLLVVHAPTRVLNPTIRRRAPRARVRGGPGRRQHGVQRGLLCRRPRLPPARRAGGGPDGRALRAPAGGGAGLRGVSRCRGRLRQR